MVKKKIVEKKVPHTFNYSQTITKRFWIRLLRWVDLILLSATAILIFIALQPATNFAYSSLCSSWDWRKLHWKVLLAVAVFLTIILWFIMGRLGGVFWKKVSCNPPIWLCGLISFILLYYIKLYSVQSNELLDHIMLLITLSVFLVCSFISSIVKNIFSICENGIVETLPVADGESKTLSELSIDPDKLRTWLEKEEPIVIPDHDCFDMKVFAKRIVRILQSSPLKTIGLVGPYGCGKSSILKMVQYYIDNPSDIGYENKVSPCKKTITCFVKGWGLREGTAAEHILKAMVKELSEYTDCIGLKTVPANYRRAMLGSGNVVMKVIASLLSGWQSPRDVLKKIDTILCRIDKRLVIFLEDIDRNKRTDIFFNEITALLDELKGLESISFVLAIGMEHKGQEVIVKVAEHIEVVPNLPRIHVANIVKLFRTNCLEKLDDKEKCIPDKMRDERMGSNRSDVVDSIVALDTSLSKPVDNIVKLLNNPRVLKTTLRRTSQAWDVLSGEIDFDDLFIATVLRAAATDVFFFINENIEQIRSLHTDRPESKDRPDKSKDDLHAAFNDIIAVVDYDREAVKGLILSIFPGWDAKYIGCYPSMRDAVRNYQRLENSWPTDYWSRLSREEFFPNEVMDQNILMTIKKWNKDIDHKAYDGLEMRNTILASEEVFNKLRQFREKIEDNTLQKLAEEQFAITLKKYGNKANDDNCPAVNQWWLLMPEDVARDVTSWEMWLLQEISKAIPISLGYVNDLCGTWLKRFPAFRDEIIKKAKSIYESKPERLIEVLDPDEIYSIRHFTNLFNFSKYNESDLTSEKWQWLAKLLLEAGNINPEIIIPQISALLCEIYPSSAKSSPSGKPTVEYYGTFQEERAKDLFNDNFEQLIKLLARKIDISKYDTNGRLYITTAQEYARQAG